MSKVRRMGGAMVLAGLIAIGFGTARLDAAKPGGGGGGNAAVCAYLKSVLAYPYLSPSIRPYVEWLYYDYYKCATR